jgi:hypothetical protein
MGFATEWVSRHPVTRLSVLSYLVLMSLNPISSFLRPAIGEISDLLMMTAFFWPYPLTLALQKIANPDTWPSWVLGYALGLGLVFMTGVWMDRILVARVGRRWVVWTAGLLAWPVVLILFELGVFFVTAVVLGWPVGV